MQAADLDRFVALRHPATTAEERSGITARLRSGLDEGRLERGDLQLDLDPEGRARAALILSRATQSHWAMSELSFAPALSVDGRRAALETLSRATDHARAAGAASIETTVRAAALSSDYAAALTSCGFGSTGTRVEMRATLDPAPTPTADPFVWRDLSQVGLERAAAVLARAAVGAPDWDPQIDCVALIRSLLDGPGLTKGPDCLELGRLGGQDLAFVMAQVDRARGWGRISYMALAPELRGRGYGAAVHQRGLSLLRAGGARSYHGGCEASNAPMLRLFERHGCQVHQRLARWLWHRERHAAVEPTPI